MPAPSDATVRTESVQQDRRRAGKFADNLVVGGFCLSSLSITRYPARFKMSALLPLGIWGMTYRYSAHFILKQAHLPLQSVTRVVSRLAFISISLCRQLTHGLSPERLLRKRPCLGLVCIRFRVFTFRNTRRDSFLWNFDVG